MRETNWSKQAKVLLKTGEVRSGMSGPELAQFLRISTASYYNRRQNPGTLKLKELSRLRAVMKFTDDELIFLAGAK